MVRLSAGFIIFMSFVSTALTITNAFFLKKQFYPSVVYLTKSSTSMAVIYFQAAVISYLVFSLIRWIFFGQLRVAEIEHAQERVWHAVMETCLAFTVFRDDFSPKFVVQFVILFFIKAFHWLSEDRVDYMERSPVITVLFHARIMGILSLLSAVDSFFISHAVFETMQRGASAQIVFGFEYAVLLAMVVHIAIKYILHIHDLRSVHPWENKAVYMLYAELFTNFLRCALYLVFAVVMVKIHTFPLFAIRPFYLSIRSLQKAVNDVILSRRAINAMNNLFPLATQQELTDGDATCIICREEMTVESGAKKLPCNHIFHPNCLRSWFQRQQTCPTCRLDVLTHQNLTPAHIVANGAANAQPAQNLFNPAANFFNFGVNFPAAAHNQLRPAVMPPVNGQAPPAGAVNQPPPMFAPFQFGFPPMMPPMMPFQAFQQQMAAAQAQNAAAGPGGAVPAAAPAQANGAPAGPQPTTPGQTPAANAQMPFMPFLPNMGALPSPFPFPQPPIFAGFSDDEISQMEGTERAAVEARIQALRNVNVLLDAAVLQFQQYTSLAPPRQFMNTFNTAVPLQPGAPAQQPPSTQSNGTAASPDQPSTSQTSSTSSPPVNPPPEVIKNVVVEEEQPPQCPSPTENTAADEIRRRRLAKFEFSSTASPDQQPSSSSTTQTATSNHHGSGSD
uniref:E3 ubiquitin-protein ligase hrd-1 n=1 Tax=Ditylenchus dipsaci TaxID=166011 RepID=A0A915EUL9_9BILA